MYCSACGSVVPSGTSYCNRCGAKAGSGKKSRENKRPQLTPDGLVWALVSVLIGGLGIVIGLTTVLKKELGFDDSMVLMFAIVSFAMVVGVSGAFLWLLIRSQRDETDERSEDIGGRGTGAIGRSPALELNAPPASIVEGTTRTLEHAVETAHDERSPLDTAGRPLREG